MSPCGKIADVIKAPEAITPSISSFVKSEYENLTNMGTSSSIVSRFTLLLRRRLI